MLLTFNHVTVSSVFEGVGVDARVWQVRSWMVAAGAHYVANLRQIDQVHASSKVIIQIGCSLYLRCAERSIDMLRTSTSQMLLGTQHWHDHRVAVLELLFC